MDIAWVALVEEYLLDAGFREGDKVYISATSSYAPNRNIHVIIKTFFHQFF